VTDILQKMRFELSVRSYNVLTNMGMVKTLDDFMALTRNQVLREPNAGQKTWREIEDMQRAFLHKEEMQSEKNLRDEFAIAALPSVIMLGSDCNRFEVAHDAYAIADAMIKARK
jgi:hypothetical protein